MKHHIYAAVFPDSSVFFTAREVDNPPEDASTSYQWAKSEENIGNGHRPLVAKTIEFKGKSINRVVATLSNDNDAEEVKSALIRHFRTVLPEGSVLNLRVNRPTCDVSYDLVMKAIKITSESISVA
ncbi:hypothetical protein DU976_20100 [Vibrio navarrensis]|nr:hypothetical protein [Vibrio navarrensis]EJL6397037.1 hypothetical protein [Vibrio navarrensis]EKA5638219.1 hypothetical protein [Vibrio navarrensis]